MPLQNCGLLWKEYVLKTHVLQLFPIVWVLKIEAGAGGVAQVAEYLPSTAKGREGGRRGREEGRKEN
jgi:hypothetical protein